MKRLCFCGFTSVLSQKSQHRGFCISLFSSIADNLVAKTTDFAEEYISQRPDRKSHTKALYGIRSQQSLAFLKIALANDP